ncbi:MAG: DUF1501 domain-containing protein [Pseudomonadales bacterium]
MMKRRAVIRGLGAGFGVAMTPFAPAFALTGNSAADPRLVVVILRGGMDGLAAVAPYGDSRYQSARGGIALERPGRDGGLLELDAFFGLHPSLENLHAMYGRKELLVLHGVASPYRARSHFDAQNVLELGLGAPHLAKQGWLNRALPLITPHGRAPEAYAMALGQSVPLILRGPQSVGSWAPDRIPDPDEDTWARIKALYADDEFLGPKLEAALMANEMAGASPTMRGRGRGNAIRVVVEASARFLRHETGPRVAVFESNGWDTHANQGTGRGQLANVLRGLDEALGILAEGLGAAWKYTAVLVVTEFGRTVAMNGTRGTDHGTASAAFVLGGAVAGGRVAADWPGLRHSDFYEGRDLRPTMDVRSLYLGLLSQHMGASEKALKEVVFHNASLRSPPRLIV